MLNPKPPGVLNTILFTVRIKVSPGAKAGTANDPAVDGRPPVCEIFITVACVAAQPLFSTVNTAFNCPPCTNWVADNCTFEVRSGWQGAVINSNSAETGPVRVKSVMVPVKWYTPILIGLIKPRLKYPAELVTPFTF